MQPVIKSDQFFLCKGLPFLPSSLLLKSKVRALSVCACTTEIFFSHLVLLSVSPLPNAWCRLTIYNPWSLPKDDEFERMIKEDKRTLLGQSRDFAIAFHAVILTHPRV